MTNKRIQSVMKALKANELFVAGQSMQIRSRELKIRSDFTKRRAKERRATEPEFRIIGNLRGRIVSALRAANARKVAKTRRLLGCTIQEFKLKIEALWLPGMSWENHGKWHLDHIKPCNAFNLLNPEEQRACFHWSNYQPLWARDNLRKSDRWGGELVRLTKAKC